MKRANSRRGHGPALRKLLLKHKPCLLFPFLVLCMEIKKSRFGACGAAARCPAAGSAAAVPATSIPALKEQRHGSSQPWARPCAAPRGKTIVRGSAKPASLKRCQEPAASGCSLPINVDGRSCGDTIFLQAPACPAAYFMPPR